MKPFTTKLYRGFAIAAVTAFLAAGFSQPAEALKWTRKMGFVGTPIDEQTAKDWQPFFWDEKDHHPLNWEGTDWNLDEYDQETWGRQALIERMYRTRILHKQYASKRIATLEVGPMFYKLSEQDKSRFMQVVADHYNIFESKFGWFEIRDWYTEELIGTYTVDGLTLQ